MNNAEGNRSIEDILRECSPEGKISCARVFEIIGRKTVFPDIAGIALDKMNIRISHCQLGLFGYTGGKNIPARDSVEEQLKEKINDNLEDGRLTCGAAWNIASELNIKRSEVASACDFMKIRINRCQLGAF